MAAVLSPTTVFAATQKVELLKTVTHSVNGMIWVDGLVRNPTQTALIDVTVVVKRISSTGRTVSTIKVPANCIVFDGLATTSFTLKRTLSSRTPKAKRVSVSVYGTPTFRRPLRLDARLAMQGYANGHRDYTIAIANSQEQTVTGAIVFGESWTYDPAYLPNAFLDSFRNTSLSALQMSPGYERRVGIRLWAPGSFTDAGVFAEAVALRKPGIDVEATEVLVASGAPATIRGTVRHDLTLAGVPKAPVVYRTSVDGSTWSAAATITASSHGAFALPVTATSLTYYSLESPGVAGTGSPSDPVVVRVYPRVVLTTPVVSASDVMTFSISGSLSAHDGDMETPVRLLCYRKVVDQWLLGLETTVTLDPAPLGAATYQATVRLPAPGQWRIEAARDGEAKHSNTVSAMRSLSVGVTTLAITASRSRVDCNTSSRIKGTFLDQHRAPIRGKGLMLEMSSNGGKTWDWLWTGRTDSAGVVAYTVHPMNTTRYRFRALEEEMLAAATSKQLTVASSSVVKTVRYPSYRGTTYLRGIRLGAGPHKAIINIWSPYDQLSVSVRVRGTSSWKNASRSFTLRSSATCDFKLTTSHFFFPPPPDTLQVRIW